MRQRMSSGLTGATDARVLRRPREQRVLVGVCAGLARYLGVSVGPVRVLFALLALLGGSGVLLYLGAALTVPEAAPGERIGPPARPAGPRPLVVSGVAAGALALVLVSGRTLPSVSGLAVPLLLLAALLLAAVALRGPAAGGRP